MNNIIIAFVSIVIMFLIISLLVLWIATYPPSFIVKKMYKNSMHNITDFYFYYNKATAYRLLFTGFNVFKSVLQILTIASTFITVYISVEASEYVTLAALISATCEVAVLMLQPEKYTKAFSDAALIMEFTLLKTLPDKELKECFSKAYEEAENRITETK